MICIRCKEEVIDLYARTPNEKPLYSCACGMTSHAINLYHPSDPAAPVELWHYVYLDGMAEDYNAVCAEYSLWEWAAPDLVCCDVDPYTVEPGEYDCLLYGKPALAIIDKRFDRALYGPGRIVLKDDSPDRIAFNRNPRNWR